MKVYEVIIDDGQNVFKTTCCTKNRKALESELHGSGRVVEVRDVTKDIFPGGTIGKLDDLLIDNGWGESETALVCALLDDFIRNRK